jgi:outer membrane protein OmpA-like peptidoglycan-associated protein
MSRPASSFVVRSRGRAAIASSSGLFALALLSLAIVPAAVAEEPFGESYLRLGVGARAFGMGGAFVAVADDATAGYWNPAGITRVTDLSLGFMATGGYSYGREHLYAGAAKSLGGLSVAANWIHMGWEGFERRVDGTETSPETFDLSGNAILLSVGRRAGLIALGATGKILTHEIGDESETGGGVDAGALVQLGPLGALGITFQDLYSHIGSTDVPINFRGGLSANPFGGLTLAADIERTEDEKDWFWHIGGEMWFESHPGYQVGVRAGGDNIGRGSGDPNVSAGLSLRFPGPAGLSIDYAFVEERQEFLGETHRFSLSFALAEGERDRDGDGMPDFEDQCPDTPEDYDGFEDDNGCPDPDNDGDGVADLEDVCPDQPEDFDGVEDDDGCPEENDRDGDQIADEEDACPDEPEDLDGYEDTDGCPDIDNDGDGIADDLDACPTQPETKNDFQDEDGCPDLAPRTLLEGINFAPGRAELLPGAAKVLDGVAAVLKADTTIRVEIQGHTDNTGAAETNLTLSQRRAEAVRKYLISQGVDAAQLDATGHGESAPIADNGTESGRAKNRRVEMIRLDKK